MDVLKGGCQDPTVSGEDANHTTRTTPTQPTCCANEGSALFAWSVARTAPASRCTDASMVHCMGLTCPGAGNLGVNRPGGGRTYQPRPLGDAPRTCLGNGLFSPEPQCLGNGLFSPGPQGPIQALPSPTPLYS